MLLYSSFMKSIPNDIQFVNLGSTYSQYAFGCYKELGLDKTYNLALPCESSEADYVKLKLLYSHFAPGCVVAITLAPCNTLYFWGQMDEGLKHYGFMPKKNKKDWKITKLIKYYFPLLPFEFRKMMKIVLDTPLKKDIYELHSLSIITDEDSEKRAKNTAEGWVEMFGLTNLKDSICNEKNQTMINENTNNIIKMIDFCQKHHFNPIIVVPPFLGKLNSFFGDSFIDSTLGSIFRLAKEKGVFVYDYRESKEFQDNNGLYIDGYFCLNKYGSVKFVKTLFRQLNNDGIIVNNERLCS